MLQTKHPRLDGCFYYNAACYPLQYARRHRRYWISTGRFPVYVILDQEEDELFKDENMLLERNYTKVKPSEVVKKQSHLSATEKNKLWKTLDLYPKLFDGKLGRVPNYNSRSN